MQSSEQPARRPSACYWNLQVHSHGEKLKMDRVDSTTCGGQGSTLPRTLRLGDDACEPILTPIGIPKVDCMCSFHAVSLLRFIHVGLSWNSGEELLVDVTCVGGHLCKFTWMDCVFWCSNPWSFACFGMSVAWSGVWTPPATSSDAELPLFNKGDFRAQVWSQIAFHVTAGSSDTDLFDYGVYRKRRLQPLRMCLEWCSARPAVIKQVIGWGGRNQWREPLGNRDTVRAFTWGAHQSQAAIKTRQWHYRKCVRADRVTPSHLFIITHLHCWVC